MISSLGYALLGGLLIVRGLHVMAYGLWEWDLARHHARIAYWSPIISLITRSAARFRYIELRMEPATTHGDVRLVRLP